MRSIQRYLHLLSCCHLFFPSRISAIPQNVIPEIAPVSSNINNAAGLNTALAATNDFAISNPGPAYLSVFNSITPWKAPDSISSVVAAAAITGPTSISDASLNAVLDGLCIFNGASLQASNSSGDQNHPTLTPKETIFPSKGPSDAPYSLSDDQLRATIHFPDEYTYGKKSPVLIVPGSGAASHVIYQSNLFKLLGEDSSYADIVWIDNPQLGLGDAQVNAEYIAYAINFISGVSNNANVSVIAWSQGTVDTQWALKYWPSTNSIVSNFVALSPGFYGTQNANWICAKYPGIACDPSLTQLNSTSNFISTLRSNGGDSAYVPTTTIYSSGDQIIRPQSGSGASGLLSDGRHVGVSNYEIQTVCAGQPGGSPYTHEGVLFSPLAMALIEDALTKPGPGSTSRLDLQTVCSAYAAPGLALSDVLATESVFVAQGYNMLAYEPKVISEPPLMTYAMGH